MAKAKKDTEVDKLQRKVKYLERRLRKHRARARRSRLRRNPREAKWASWNHDLDTILHELVRNEGIVHRDEHGTSFVPAKLVIQYAEQYADELHALQERRRPRGLKPGWL